MRANLPLLLVALLAGGQATCRAAAPPELPVPPIPPAHVPPRSRFAPAPVPDLDAAAPDPPAPSGLSVAPSTFRLSVGAQGAGYPYGSSALGMAQSRAALVPGLVLRWPVK